MAGFQATVPDLKAVAEFPVHWLQFTGPVNASDRCLLLNDGHGFSGRLRADVNRVLFVADSFSDAGERGVEIPTTVRLGPEDGHATTRRRRFAGEEEAADSQM